MVPIVKYLHWCRYKYIEMNKRRRDMSGGNYARCTRPYFSSYNPTHVRLSDEPAKATVSHGNGMSSVAGA